MVTKKQRLGEDASQDRQRNRSSSGSSSSGRSSTDSLVLPVSFPGLLDHLPDELIWQILSYLPADALAKLSRVCKAFQMLTNTDRLWKPLYLHQYPAGNPRADGVGFRRLYQLARGRYGRFARAIGNIKNPYALAVGPDGHLVAVDMQNRHIFVIAPDTFEVIRFGWINDLGLELKAPCSVTVCRQNVIYLSDTQSHRVLHFELDGRFIRSVGTRGDQPGQLYFPGGITIIGDEMVVCDSGNNRVQMFDLRGNFVRVLGSEIADPQEVSSDRLRRIYVASHVESDNDSIFCLMFTIDGQLLSRFLISHQRAMPTALTVDFAGRLMCCHSASRRILVFENGALVYEFSLPGQGVGNFEYPCGLVMDTTGHLVVADTHNDRLQLFTIM